MKRDTEPPNGNQLVYLVTVSRTKEGVLSDGRAYRSLESMTREDIGDAVRDAFDNPVASGCRGG